MSEPTPSESTPLTPDALESLLSGLDHGAFVAFVSDLRERRGWDVDREGSLLTATRPDGERERLLVWSDDRSRLERLLDAEPDAPDVAPVDAVVTREQDVATARTVADALGARVLDTAAIHDRLLYAIDRGSCRALCEAHFDRPVDPRPAPDAPEADPEPAGTLGPRTVLVAVALFGLVVAAAAGLPGGSPGNDLDAAPADPPGAPDATPVDRGGVTDTPARTPPPGPPDTFGPGTPGQNLCPACPSLLTFGDDPPTVAPGSTTTLVGTLRNPYPFGLDDVVIELRGPENWTVTAVNGTIADTLGPGESRPVAWELAVPDGAAGNYTLGAVTVYADGRSTVRTAGAYEVAVAEPGLRPPESAPCIEALGPLTDGGSCYLLTFPEDRPAITAGTTTTVSGTLYNPRPYALTNGSVTLETPGANWSVAPANGTTFERLPPGALRRAAWNVTPPVTASGTYTLTGTTTYTREGGSGRANRSTPRDYRLSVAPAAATQPPAETPCNLDSGPVNASGPCYLLAFPEDPPVITAGTTTTITGRLYNPREYALANGSVTLAPPGPNWTITPVRGTTFDRLEPGEVRVAQWNLTAPASASGTVDVRGVTNYTRLGGPGDATVSLAHRYPVEVATPMVPFDNGSETTVATDASSTIDATDVPGSTDATDAAVPSTPSARVAP